jgi:N-acetylneuraminic acid mutarotase
MIKKRQYLRLLQGLVLAVLITAGAIGAEDWQVRSNIPYHVYGHAAATLQGKIHLLGGDHTSDWQKPSATHQVYDPIADKWESKADLPMALAWEMVSVYKDKIYVFGGAYNKPGLGIASTDKACVYDPATDKWSGIHKLPELRMNGFAATVGKYIYISLGYNRQGPKDEDVKENYKSTYRYDPEKDTYTRVADAPITGCYIASGPYQGKVYAVPGSYVEQGWHKGYQLADGAIVYDPAADRWAKIDAPRVMKRVFFLTQCSSSAIDADGRLWVVGGIGEDRARTVVSEYLDIKKAVFVRGPDIAFGRCCGGGGIANGDTLSIMGGFVAGSDLGLGNPAMPTWTLDTTKLK